MALRGSIDDVPIVDVLQFVHLSGKSGTLALTSAAGPAWVEFSQGNIVFARGPQSRSLGELLVEHGGLTKEQVHEAIEAQRRDPARPPLGKLLLARQIIAAEPLADCVRRQIHEAMMDLANWSSGDFQFDQGTIEVLDDIRVEVAEVLPLLKLNTQFLLFEAVRLFDERQRDKDAAQAGQGPELPAGREKTLPPALEKRERTLPPASEGALEEGREPPRAGPLWREIEPVRSVAPGAEARIVGEPLLLPPGREARQDGGRTLAGGILLVGFEKALSPPVTKTLVVHGYRVLGHVPRREIETQLLADKRWPAAMVLLWRLHAGEGATSDEVDKSLKLVERLVERHPGWSFVVLVSGGATKAVARAYATGARAALPIDPVELAREAEVREGLVAVVAQIWKDSARTANAQAAELRAWIQAKRVTSEMQRALQQASIALELMRVAAATLDRATLFLAKEAELIGLGAFGSTVNGSPMAESLRGLALTVAPDSPLSRCLVDRTAFVGPTAELGIGQLFFDIAGRPLVDRGVLVPLVGPSKAIGVLYGDNGQLPGPMRGIHALEIAATQAGIAYENVLLRMRLDVRSRQGEAESPLAS